MNLLLLDHENNLHKENLSLEAAALHGYLNQRASSSLLRCLLCFQGREQVYYQDHKESSFRAMNKDQENYRQ